MDYNNKTLKGKELDSYKQRLVLNSVQREIIIGSLLGDASMGLRLGKPVYSIKFEQSINNELYINHIYTVLEPFVGVVPSICMVGDTWYSKYFRTYRHPSFKFYFDIFYPATNNYIKVVPKTINRLLTPRALAYWYMNDGFFDGSYLLHTKCFSISDQRLLLNALGNFNIKANIHKDKDKFRIFILSESRETFKGIISPYLIKCFDYKL